MKTLDHQKIIDGLARNKEVFRTLLSGVEEEEFRWRTAPEKWCLLEIVCHLRDEEKEDFRERCQRVLDSPEPPLPPIDPEGWVSERAYGQQDYHHALKDFLEERTASIKWLNALETPQWTNSYTHSKLGPMSAEFLLTNWLAHDQLHMRQIIRLKFARLQQVSGLSLSYAGNW